MALAIGISISPQIEPPSPVASESDPINPSPAPSSPVAELAPALPSQHLASSAPLPHLLLGTSSRDASPLIPPRTVPSTADHMLRHCTGSSHHQSVAASPAAAMASTTFSLFFPLPNKGQWSFDDDHSTITTSPSSPSSTSSAGTVDCTLSLGTPSSRRAAAADPTELGKCAAAQAQRACPSVSASAVSWEVAADQSYYCCQGSSKPAGKGAAVARGEHDSLLVDRRCAKCGTSSTPLWRNGPRGPKTLCNACGIRFKKEERRAAATATAAMDHQSACGHVAQQYYGPPGKQPPGAVPFYGEGAAFPCGGDVPDADVAPFLAWRMNVVAPPATAPAFAVWPERTSLFRYN